MGRDWKAWLKAALIRAVKTFAQTMVASITVGMTIEEVQWPHVLSVSGLAFALSILTSLAGIPEVPEQQPPDTAEKIAEAIANDNE